MLQKFIKGERSIVNRRKSRKKVKRKIQQNSEKQKHNYKQNVRGSSKWDEKQKSRGQIWMKGKMAK